MVRGTFSRNTNMATFQNVQHYLTVLCAVRSKLQPLSLVLVQVGVRFAEMRHFTGWEILAHRLPKLLNLTLVFIGDECPTGEFPKDFTYKSKDVQQERSKDLTIRYVLYPKLYQDYAKLSTFIKPDVVAALGKAFAIYHTSCRIKILFIFI